MNNLLIVSKGQYKNLIKHFYKIKIIFFKIIHNINIILSTLCDDLDINISNYLHII